jgi:LysM repeat protein
MKSRMLLMIVALVVLASLVVVPAVSASPLPGQYGGNEGRYCSYHVRYGDTLSKIAYRYDTSVWHLRELNRVRNPNCIYAGEWLLVPCDREERADCGYGGCNSYKPVNYGCKNCKNDYKPVYWGNNNSWGKHPTPYSNDN